MSDKSRVSELCVWGVVLVGAVVEVLVVVVLVTSVEVEGIVVARVAMLKRNSKRNINININIWSGDAGHCNNSVIGSSGN